MNYEKRGKSIQQGLNFLLPLEDDCLLQLALKRLENYNPSTLISQEEIDKKYGLEEIDGDDIEFE
ncbi:hypothetical protein [Veillonella intestinalis]|uniref:hypothetical protein n=1 Tax=Veillonella intestinalis TaxID=2941341 RepID=UPI00203C485D|nr:hypothetical protein [Veillonella intestinalis]